MKTHNQLVQAAMERIMVEQFLESGRVRMLTPQPDHFDRIPNTAQPKNHVDTDQFILSAHGFEVA